LLQYEYETATIYWLHAGMVTNLFGTNITNPGKKTLTIYNK